MSKGGPEPFERGVLPGIRGPLLTGRRRCGSGCSAILAQVVATLIH
jgi:hypothetical protein